jgi:hypothetical protein
MTFSNQQIARFSGAGYLIIFITGIFANFFVIEGLISPGDAATTAATIQANESLFRTGIFSFIIMVIFDVLLAWTLYILFKPVHNTLSLLCGWLRLANGTVFGIALFHLLAVLQILSGAEYLKAFSPAQLDAQVMQSLASFNNTWLIGLLFFGMHLLLLGYLIYKSGYVPRFIGILLCFAAIGYLIDSCANFMLSNYADYKDIFMMIVVIPGVIGEFSLTIWLLIKNNKVPEMGD